MTINILQERPVLFADFLGRTYTGNTISDHKKKYGQYLTPVVVADFMGGFLSSRKKESLSILDPGIGIGILACAACENAVRINPGLKKITITGYEVDSKILPSTNESMDYLTRWLGERNVRCDYKIITDDFILRNADILDGDGLLFSDGNDSGIFDVIISNPPYFKIGKDDPRAQAASRIVHGQPNVYSLFMALSAYLLEDDGDLIYITPRSYTSGYYFRAFRQIFFDRIIPQRFHLFGSRKEAFARDEILQENLIIHGRKRTRTNIKLITKTTISHSNNSQDLAKPEKKKALLKDVIDLSSVNRYVFLPLSDEEEEILSFVNGWTCNLHSLGMEISTGKVVPFRAREVLHLATDTLNEYAPMIWMNHIKDSDVTWPLPDWRKEQYISVNDVSASLLIPNGNYILMRRFSPKEDLKRINTAPFLHEYAEYQYLGLENHVNYIHRPHGELSAEEVAGLSAILNSRYLDVYFRTLNGNTEVSATEMREIPLPDYSTISSIGAEILKKGIRNIIMATGLWDHDEISRMIS